MVYTELLLLKPAIKVTSSCRLGIPFLVLKKNRLIT